jgi:inhibitor of cysteine peptidase
MNNLSKIILLLSLTFTNFIVLAESSANNLSDPNKAIQVSQKDSQFNITLAANPTTGYVWLLEKYDPNFVTVVKHVFQAPDTKLVGAGGVDVWTFKLTPVAFSAPHILKIKLLYARPWLAQQQGGEGKEFTVVTH